MTIEKLLSCTVASTTAIAVVAPVLVDSMIRDFEAVKRKMQASGKYSGSILLALNMLVNKMIQDKTLQMKKYLIKFDKTGETLTNAAWEERAGAQSRPSKIYLV